MNNYKFAITRWWLSTGLEVLQTSPDIFTSKKLREATKYFIAGSTVLKSISSWMSAAQLTEKRKKGLTDFGLAISKNDPKLTKSATWWSIHLSLCFSDSSDPYSHFFLKLDYMARDWLLWLDLSERIYSSLDEVSEQSLDSSLEGIKKMFQGDSPLAELGLIETRKEQKNSALSVRLGTPELSDEIIIHALALTRHRHFRNRDSVDFTTLSKTGLPHFLCCSSEYLRQQLKSMSQMNKWHDYFSFDHAVDLDSISFKEQCMPAITLLLLLQKGQDTWL